MNNITKIILGLGAAGLLIWVVLFLTLNSRLNDAIAKLETAQSRIDSSLTTLSAARTVIDSVRGDLARFSSYLRDIQGRVEILDLSERSANTQFRTQKESIVRRLRELYKDVETTGSELPEIPIVGKGG
jgi:chromosome segregation ATPase